MHQGVWRPWLESLPEEQRARAEALRRLVAEMGAYPNPEDWVYSDVAGGTPEIAKLLLLSELWSSAIDVWNEHREVMEVPAAVRLIENGADADDVVRLMRAASFRAVLAALRLITSDDPDDSRARPRWRLMEMDEQGRMTGREMRELDADLGWMDPSGRNAFDLSE